MEVALVYRQFKGNSGGSDVGIVDAEACRVVGGVALIEWWLLFLMRV
jgi:hypothetical protein